MHGAASVEGYTRGGGVAVLEEARAYQQRRNEALDDQPEWKQSCCKRDGSMPRGQRQTREPIL